MAGQNVDGDMAKQRAVPKDKKKLRNLQQFAEMTDEEFDEYFEGLVEQTRIDPQVQDEQIEEKLKEFESDYDLSDMKINDKLVLRNLIISLLSLEDLETKFAGLRMDVSEETIVLLDKLSRVMASLRSDISSMQNDLKLTRKIRKEGQEENFMTWLENTKRKAMKFYEQKMLYIFCPECKMLLANVWLLYPDENNVIDLHCKRCDHTVVEELAPLYKTKNRNIEEVALG